MAFLSLDDLAARKKGSASTAAPPASARPPEDVLPPASTSTVRGNEQIVIKSPPRQADSNGGEATPAPPSGGRRFVPLDLHQRTRQERATQDEAQKAARQAELEGRFSPVDSAIIGASDMISAGFADEIAGVYEGVFRGVRDPANFRQRFSEGYTDFTEGSRKILEDASEANPKSYLGGQIVGGLVSLPFGGAELKAATTAAKAVPRVVRGVEVAGEAANVARAVAAPVKAFTPLSATQKAKAIAKAGAVQGGVYGVGSGEGFEDRAASGLAGAVTGGVVGGVFGLAAPAASALTKGVGSAAKGIGRAVGLVEKVSPQQAARQRAADLVGDALARDEASAALAGRNAADDYEGVMRAAERGQPVVAGDLGGREMSKLARKASAKSDAASMKIAETVRDRADDQASRLSRIVEDLYGGRGSLNMTETGGELSRLYKASTRPLYERAMNDPTGASLWTSRLEELAQSPSMQRAIMQAERRSRDLAPVEGVRPVKSPFIRDADGNMTLDPSTGATPSLAFWDIVKRNLDGQVSQLRPKDPARAREIEMLRDELRGHLDDLVPTYRTARGDAAAFFRAENAVEAGQKFARQNTASGLTDVQDMMARLRANPERAAEAELFERGLVSEIIGKANLSEGDLTAKLFGRSQMSKLRAAGVPEFRIREIEDTMRVERMMGRLRKDATAAPSNAEAVGDLLNAGLDVATSGFSLRSLAFTAARFGAKRFGARMSEAEAIEVADLLTRGSADELRALMQRTVAGEGGRPVKLIDVMEYGLTRTLPKVTTAGRLEKSRDQAEQHGEARGDRRQPAGPSGQGFADGGPVLSKQDIESMTHTRSYGTGRRPAYLETMGQRIPIGETVFYDRPDGTQYAPGEEGAQFLHDAARLGVYGVPMVGPAVGAALDVTEAVATDDPLSAGLAVAFGPSGKLAKGAATGAMAASMSPSQANSDELAAIERLGAKTREMLWRRAAAKGTSLQDEYTLWLQLSGGGKGFAKGGGVKLARPLPGIVVVGEGPDIKELVPKRRKALATGGHVKADQSPGAEAYMNGSGKVEQPDEPSHYDHKGRGTQKLNMRGPTAVASASSRRPTSTTDRSRQRMRPERLRAAAPPVDPRAFWRDLQQAMTDHAMQRGLDVSGVQWPAFDDPQPADVAVSAPLVEPTEAALEPKRPVAKAPLAPHLKAAAAKKRAKRIAQGKPHEPLP